MNSLFTNRVWRFTCALLFSLSCLSAARAYEIDNKSTFAVGKFVYHMGSEVGDGKAWLVGVKPGIKLEGEITFPGSVTVNDVKYTVTRIGAAPPNGYDELWWYNYTPAIIDHPGITKINVPSTIEDIETYEFLGCLGIAEFHVNANNQHFKDENGILFRKYNNHPNATVWDLFRMPPATKKTWYTVPKGISGICNCAFADNKSIKKIILGGNLSFSPFWGYRNLGINTIDISAADHFDSLGGVIYLSTIWTVDDDPMKKYSWIETCPPALHIDKLTLPASVTHIGHGAFSNTNISEIDIPNSLINIDRFAFFNSNIKKVKIAFDNLENGMSHDGAFLDCKQLDYVEFVGSKSRELLISPRMFQGCEKLTTVSFDSEKLNLRSYAFYGCKSLTSFPFAKINSWETGWADEDRGFQFAHSGLTSVRIPSGFKYVPRGFCMGAPVKSLNLNPSGKCTVKTICEQAFKDCQLTEVTFDFVKEIKTDAFAGNPLKKVVFTSSEDTDEYTGETVDVYSAFTPDENTWFYIGNNYIDWDQDYYDFSHEFYNYETGKYDSGLEKATYVTSARRCSNVPRNFKAVYGPAGCRTDPWGGSTDQIGWSAVGTGEVIETFYAHSVNDKTALEVAQTPEAAAVTFEMVSLKIGDTYATNSGNIWGGTGTSNVLAHERTFRYKVNGVEMHICYPGSYSTESIEDISADKQIISIFSINGVPCPNDLNSLATGFYIVTYSDGSVKRLLK